MRRFYTLAIIVVAGMLMSISAATARLILILPDTPCDSTSCAAITIDSGRVAATIVESMQFRDGHSFVVDPAVMSTTFAPGAAITLPICFSPTRRGQTTDSLQVVLQSQGALDTLFVRVTGRAIGPEIEPDPFVLDFPRTSPGSSATMSVTLRNSGELPYTFDAADLPVQAPFQLLTSGPITVAPGSSAAISIAFAPTATGIFSTVVDLAAGCALKLQLGLNGSTEFIGTGAILRLSKARFNPINDEETSCSVQRCTPVTISNAGNSPLVVEDIRWSLASSGYNITAPASVPLIIAPQQQHTFEVCLNNPGRGRFRDTLVVKSNSRSSIAFGLLVDVSTSMDTVMNCGAGFRPRRLDQAITQAQRFIGNTLLYLPAVGVQDHLTVMKYAGIRSRATLFPLQPITDASRAAAQATLNGLRMSDSTRTGSALFALMDSVSQSPLRNRVIVLLSDGDANPADKRAYPVQRIVNRALALGIRIYAIGIDVGVIKNRPAHDYLDSIARMTGAEYFDGNDCGTLQEAFEAITNGLSRGALDYEPFSMRVTEPVVVSSGDLVFDSTYYHTTTCLPMSLTNIGEGDAIIDSIQLRTMIGATTDEFSFGPSTSFPITIPESGQIVVDICFRPDGLRLRGGTTAFSYNSCSPDILRSQLSGTGWAIAGMRIDDEKIGLPGSLVTMPVHLDSTLAAFEVGTVTFSVRWNKSMLDLRSVRPREAAGTGSVVLAEPVRFEAGDAIARFVASGDFTSGTGALAELEFLVLRGDSLASDVMLADLVFEDNNPKPLMKNAGMVAFDSTCFRSTKAIRHDGAIAKVSAVDVSPVPARRGQVITLSLRSDGLTGVHISMYSSTGTLVAAPIDQLVASAGQATLSSEALAPGAYYVVVEDGSGATHVRSIVVSE